ALARAVVAFAQDLDAGNTMRPRAWLLAAEAALDADDPQQAGAALDAYDAAPDTGPEARLLNAWALALSARHAAATGDLPNAARLAAQAATLALEGSPRGGHWPLRIALVAADIQCRMRRPEAVEALRQRALDYWRSTVVERLPTDIRWPADCT